MSAWLPAALLSLFSFGLWGLFTKLAVQHIDFKSALIYQTLGVILIGLITLNTINYKPMIDTKGFSYALLMGLAYGVGCLFYFVAASKGKIITIVTLTSLYPVVTIFFAYLLLKEGVSLKQCLGIVCAFLAIFLLSG